MTTTAEFKQKLRENGSKRCAAINVHTGEQCIYYRRPNMMTAYCASHYQAFKKYADPNGRCWRKKELMPYVLEVQELLFANTHKKPIKAALSMIGSLRELYINTIKIPKSLAFFAAYTKVSNLDVLIWATAIYRAMTKEPGKFAVFSPRHEAVMYGYLLLKLAPNQLTGYSKTGRALYSQPTLRAKEMLGRDVWTRVGSLIITINRTIDKKQEILTERERMFSEPLDII